MVPARSLYLHGRVEMNVRGVIGRTELRSSSVTSANGLAMALSKRPRVPREVLVSVPSMTSPIFLPNLARSGMARGRAPKPSCGIGASG